MLLRTVQQKRADILLMYFIILSVIIVLLYFVTHNEYFNIPFVSEIIKANKILIAVYILSILLTVTIFLVFHGLFKGGLKYAFSHYKIVKAVNKELQNAGVFVKAYIGMEEVAKIPKIKLEFDRNMQTGSLKIRNTLKDTSKIDNEMISCALGNYIVERQYLSDDFNWRIYEIFDSSFDRQYQFNTTADFLQECRKYGNYEFMIDKVNRSVNLTHLLCTGVTGGGKSFFIYQLVLQMLAKPIDYQIYCCDPKQSGLGVIGNNINPNHTAVTVDEIIELLRDFDKAMQQRKKDMEQSLSKSNNIDVDYRSFSYSPMVLNFDEYLSFNQALSTYPKADRDAVLAILSSVVLLGRQLGCFLWIAMQSSPANKLESFIRDNLIFKVCMGNVDAGTIVTTFGVSADVPQINYKIGFGCFTYSGSVNTPKLMAVPTIKHFEVIETIKQLTNK